ncbi:MAG TPA: glycosyltransferase family 4 protein [Usitatibacter sp.]|nr:glycosyltransferase family 4 protein [Usitatibacter sp.]
MSSFAVLHITSLLGGGVDRHVRDITRAAAGEHVAWHVSARADVLEVPRREEILPIDPQACEREPAALAAWLRARRIGIIHAHAVSEAARARTRWAAHELGVPFVVTVHDVLFLRADGLEPGAPPGPDPRWLAGTSAFLHEAAAVVVPSQYIGDLVLKHTGIHATVVPNGTSVSSLPPSPQARAEFLARRPRHVAAVIGAIGPHKGSAILDALSFALAGSDIAVVVVGYLDMQVVPGWRGDHVFVHGAYQDDEVGPLLAAYGAEIALFPHQVPESFSYTLSDAWAAGLPVLVPREGALGERLERHGGGWFLPPGFGASEVAAQLRRLLSAEGAADVAKVRSGIAVPDPGRVPTLADMTRSLDALYERFGIDPSAAPAPDSPQVKALLARNLDGALFRQELVRLADEIGQVRAALEHERGEAAKFAAEARAWIAKLEADIAGVQSDLAREVEERRALGQENVQLGIHKAAFDLLPDVIRRMLLKKILNARS